MTGIFKIHHIQAEICNAVFRFMVDPEEIFTEGETLRMLELHYQIYRLQFPEASAATYLEDFTNLPECANEFAHRLDKLTRIEDVVVKYHAAIYHALKYRIIKIDRDLRITRKHLSREDLNEDLRESRELRGRCIGLASIIRNMSLLVEDSDAQRRYLNCNLKDFVTLDISGVDDHIDDVKDHRPKGFLLEFTDSLPLGQDSNGPIRNL